MTRLTAEDLAGSQIAGASFAQQMLVRVSADEVPELISGAVEQIVAAVQAEDYTPSEVVEMLQAFAAGAQAELARIAATSSNMRMGHA
jgi:hypothetical protein